MSIKLSVCIPSYNRAAFLPDLLASIVKQYDESVEIVICDNGSTDQTEEVARDWQRRYPRIVYERFLQNVGPDRCFLRSVEMGSGEFCWLMGDDDIIEEGGLKRVLSSLNDSITGVTVNRVAYDFRLEKSWREPSLGRSRDEIFYDPELCFEKLFVLFGFLSAQVVRRSLWLAVINEEDVSPYFNAYALIYIIGRMIQKNPHWGYIHTPCVGWRSDNDSFARQLGNRGRFALDVIGYSTIIKGLFGAQKVLQKKMFAKVCSTHFFGHVRKIKLSLDAEIKEVFILCFKYLTGISVFWYKILPFLLIPRRVLLIVRPLYRGYKAIMN